MEHDDEQRRCPRLGGQVRFEYCRTGADRQPCFKVFDCWWERFDVVGHLRGTLPAAQFARLEHPEPVDKIGGLLEALLKARQSVARSG